MARQSSHDGSRRRAWPELGRNGPAWLTCRPIAHRGLYDLTEARPENSLAAFEAACAAGFPIELDVQMTKDGRLVVLHDHDLERAAGVRGRISETALHELERLRLFDTPERIPLLEEVLDTVAGRVPVLVELKARARPTDLAARVLDSVGEYRGDVALASFHPWPLLQLRRLACPRPVGQIVGQLSGAPILARMLTRVMVTNLLTRPDFISCEVSLLGSPAAQFWRRRGAPLIAWTVRSPEEASHALTLAENYIFAGFRPSCP